MHAGRRPCGIHGYCVAHGSCGVCRRRGVHKSCCARRCGGTNSRCVARGCCGVHRWCGVHRRWVYTGVVAQIATYMLVLPVLRHS
eukprot:1722863-Pyramimonas_sp.AAC.1